MKCGRVHVPNWVGWVLLVVGIYSFAPSDLAIDFWLVIVNLNVWSAFPNPQLPPH